MLVCVIRTPAHILFFCFSFSPNMLQMKKLIRGLQNKYKPLSGLLVYRMIMPLAEKTNFIFFSIVQNIQSQGRNSTINRLFLAILHRINNFNWWIHRIFSVNSHLLKFVSLCNDLRTNLLSNHADDTWLTVVIIALHYHCYKL